MPCPPGHTICPWCHNIFHAMPAKPYLISSYVYQGNTIYHSMPSQTIPYTMSCLPGHTLYSAMSVRPYNITCHARQAITYILQCSPDHTIYHAMSGRPYHILQCSRYLFFPISIVLVKFEANQYWPELEFWNQYPLCWRPDSNIFFSADRTHRSALIFYNWCVIWLQHGSRHLP